MLLLTACAGTGGQVVSVTQVVEDNLSGLGDETRSQLAEIKESRDSGDDDALGLKKVINQTPNYTVDEYLSLFPEAGNPSALNYTVGGYDVLDIIVYEETDLTRTDIPVSADGYISFPLIGRVKVAGLTTSEIENRIVGMLADGQYLLDAHVSVTVKQYKSKQYIVLGSVRDPGSNPLQAKERVLDAISKAGGIDFEQGGKQGMLIRSAFSKDGRESKIVIRVDLAELLKGGDQVSNLLLMDKDVLYIPKAEQFYIIGQVLSPGAYPYREKEITIVEAISQAGGFTPIAARNRTRIIRVENDVEKIIQVQVDAITDSGMKQKDVVILPGDVIVVPESFF